MNVISTNNMSQSVDTAIPINCIEDFTHFGTLQAPLSDTVIELSNEHRQQAMSIIAAGLCSLNLHAVENSAAKRVIGQASAIARLDCTITSQGKLAGYEVEERPSGLGIVHTITQRFIGESMVKGSLQSHFRETFDGQLPTVLISPNRDYGTDDHLILPTETLGFAEGKPLILVRAEPLEVNGALLESLVPRSISTIADKGLKLGRIDEGLARLVCEPTDLPTADESFVIKPARGSKAKGILTYLTPSDIRLYGKAGTSTHTKVRKKLMILSNDNKMLCEPFRPPIRVELSAAKGANLLLRLLATVSKETIVIIGGTYVARPNIIIHGARDAFSGAILVQ